MPSPAIWRRIWASGHSGAHQRVKLCLSLAPHPGRAVDSIAAALPDDNVLTPDKDEPNVYPGVLAGAREDCHLDW